METKFKIIETEDYILTLSDEEIKDVRQYKGKYHIEKGSILNIFPDYLTDLSECKLIIAYQPKGNAPELVLPLLPPYTHPNCCITKDGGLTNMNKGCAERNRCLEIVVEDAVEKLAELKYPISKGGSMWMPTAHDCNQANKQEGFIAGYKAATKVYSENDLRKAFEHAIVFKEESVSTCKEAIDAEFDALIKLIKLPKTPKWFVAEMERVRDWDKRDINGDYEAKLQLKTTTINGKTTVVGKYLNE